MKYRQRFKTSSLYAAALSSALLATPALAQAQPNIVLILSDDHNWRDLGYTGTSSVTDKNGNPVRPETANIDALAQKGLLFDRGYTPNSLCRPSLTSIFTGLNAGQSGILGNNVYDNGTRAGNNTVQNDMLRRNIEYNATIPRVLTDEGYSTLQTGKWWEGAYQRAGFTDGVTVDGDRHIGKSNANSIGRKAGSIETRIGGFVDQAIVDNKPFFVSYAPLLPHTPHDASAAYRARYDDLVNSGDITKVEADYLATVDWFDDTVGELRDVMKDRGVDENTVYIYATDNGYYSGTRQTSLGNGRAKLTAWDDGVRTPIMIYQPGAIEDTTTSLEDKMAAGKMASTTDIMTTIMGLVGHEKQDNLQGIDLLSQQRTRMFGDTYSHSQFVRTDGQYEIGDPERSRQARYMVDGDWKLILVDQENVDLDAGTDPNSLGAIVQLYNLASDPGETTNLAGTDAARVAAMTTELETWWTSTRPIYHYDDEFNGSNVGSGGNAPDVRSSSYASARWEADGGVLEDGEVRGGSTGQLDFNPDSDKRYELRAKITPLSGEGGVYLGFLDAGAASGSVEDDLLAGVLSRDAAAANDLQFFAEDDGSLASSVLFESDEQDVLALTLVLDTSDNDETMQGDQWAVALLVNGIERYEHIFTDGNPLIEHIALGGIGTAGVQVGSVDYLQLVETPTYEFAAVPEPTSLGLFGSAALAMMRPKRN